MSRDIFVLDLPADARTIEAIPQDFGPWPLGSRSDLRAAIFSVAPFANFADRAWGQIETPAYSIEVNPLL